MPPLTCIISGEVLLCNGIIGTFVHMKPGTEAVYICTLKTEYNLLSSTGQWGTGGGSHLSSLSSSPHCPGSFGAIGSVQYRYTYISTPVLRERFFSIIDSIVHMTPGTEAVYSCTLKTEYCLLSSTGHRGTGGGSHLSSLSSSPHCPGSCGAIGSVQYRYTYISTPIPGCFFHN